MPQISVIVPVYKVESYLHRCVDSILNQTFYDFELILVDDGSPDNCGAICDEYAIKDNRIHVIHQENSGLSAARNMGIDWSFANSDSQWLTFIDSDDWVHPQYLEILYKAVCKYNSKVSVCGFVRADVQTDSFQQIGSDIYLVDTKEFYIKENTNFVIACGKLYAKKCFDNIRYPVGKIHEDEFVTYKILFEYNNIPIVNKQLYYYFTNPTGIMNSPFSLRKYDGIVAREERMLFFNERGFTELADREKEGIVFETAFYSLVARKTGLYNKVLKKYRVNLFKALKCVKNSCTRDQFEWIMNPYFPTYIKLLAIYHKIADIIFKKKK